MLKAEKYAPNNRIYMDLANYYNYIGDYYKEVEYSLKVQNKEQEWLLNERNQQLQVAKKSSYNW